MVKADDHRFDYRKFRRTTARRNFGYGKLLTFAAHIVLLWLYGYGHHQTRHAHHVRFCRFVAFLRTEFQIVDARHIQKHHLETYAVTLNGLARTGQMKLSYAQNLLSSVNTVMLGFRRDHAVWIAPAEAVGRRSQVRTVMPGGNWSQVEEVVERLKSGGNERAAAVVLLARAFGMRYREAVLGDLNRMKREVSSGHVTILEGTKGGRRCASRRVPIGERQQHALDFALQVRPDGSANLLAEEETFKGFLDTAAKTARPVLKACGIRCFHDLRAARMIELYESISGQPAPVRGLSLDPGRDTEARAQVALQSGHGEHRTSVAYVGGKSRRSQLEAAND
ncbi:integrase domain-containing protein [Stutzerimonas nitrititolerans]|uniref:integrase domain-containing protein n=1 Tax=Stutzerimonas nitrititolerans TaxID=2482751 RepID=UPI00289EFDEE|nr:integrase domain-containing protein [Stutzerimonas nitrititolerans]